MAANHRMCFVSGGRLASDPGQEVIELMSSLEFIQERYPMLTSWGVRDEDVLVHSLGCGVWNALGAALGYMAVPECPVPMTHGADIRTDSTWFCRTTRTPAALVEFERFDGSGRGRKKLEDKLGNLMEAAARWGGSPKLLILSAWSKGVVSVPDKEALRRGCRQGFRSPGGVRIPAVDRSAVLFNRFVFHVQRDGALLLGQTRCERLS